MLRRGEGWEAALPRAPGNTGWIPASGQHVLVSVNLWPGWAQGSVKADLMIFVWFVT